MSIFAPYFKRLRSTIGLMPLTTDQKIGGSNPSGVTKQKYKRLKIKYLRFYFSKLFQKLIKKLSPTIAIVIEFC